VQLTPETVRHVAYLARLGLSEEEVTLFVGQLSQILENFAVLSRVDTSNVPPTAQVITLQNRMREDEVAPSLPRVEVLQNAPAAEDGLFRVKAVLE
jgi:aspartyl-tRNA(Asn)/glutamyl-tRNA(Gln) amidotransferase subunit C